MTAKNQEEVFDNESLDLSLWKKIMKLMENQKKSLATAFTFVFFESIIAILLPVLNKYAIDVFFVGEGTSQDIFIFGLAYLALISFQAYLGYLFIYQSGRIEMAVSYETRNNVMKKLQSLSFSFYDKTPSGWIMARVTSDISRLSSILSWSLVDLVWGGFMMILLILVMLFVNVKLALIVIVMLPFVFVVSSWFQKRMLGNYRKIRTVNSEITSGFSEGISGSKTSKTLSLEESQFEEFSNTTEKMKTKALHAIFLSSLYMPAVIFLSSLSEAGILWIGSEMVLKELLAIGTLIMFTQYAGQFFQPLRSIAAILAELQMAQASAERILSLLETEDDLQDRDDVIEKYGSILKPKAEAYANIQGSLEFKNVDFYYKENEVILKDFNLKIEAKQRIALVGETGSGKSTIVNLICRFYEPVSGEILVDGLDYREKSMGYLRSQLGYVLQSPHLFSGSIKDNIKFGKLDASDEEVVAVSKLVGVHDFIKDLKDGYNTDVGEGGDKLSMGQKQLVSFARALIVDPAIFVLDEATSSIDTETEAIIQYAVESLLKDKTSIIIAHRLSTIVNVDRILVIDKGIILEDGSHQELMRAKGKYFELYTSQKDESVEVK